MLSPEEPQEFLHFRASQHERGSVRLVKAEVIALITAMITIAVRHGLRQSSDQQTDLLGGLIVIASLLIAVSCIVRYRWSLRRSSFLREHWGKVSFAGLFLVGSVTVFSVAHLLPVISGPAGPRFEWLYAYSEGLILSSGNSSGFISQSGVCLQRNQSCIVVGRVVRGLGDHWNFSAHVTSCSGDWPRSDCTSEGSVYHSTFYSNFGKLCDRVDCRTDGNVLEPIWTICYSHSVSDWRIGHHDVWCVVHRLGGSKSPSPGNRHVTKTTRFRSAG